MRALITGATGFIGRRLLELIEEPVVVTRNPDRARAQFKRAEIHAWNPEQGPPPAAALRDVEAVFNLAGDSIGEGRWTAEKKHRLRASRVVCTTNLVQGIASSATRPPVLVSASAVGYYGSRGDELLNEESSPASDFLAELCVAWEQAAAPARELGVRVVHPRIGVVLGPDGGALAKMLPPFKMGVGGRLGDGQQWMSWVHLDDVVGIMLHAANKSQLSGPINATAPHAVRNVEFTKVLGRVLHRPTILPAPAFALRIALGEFADVLLGSQRVLPAVAEHSGYTFMHTDLEGALRSSIR